MRGRLGAVSSALVIGAASGAALLAGGYMLMTGQTPCAMVAACDTGAKTVAVANEGSSCADAKVQTVANSEKAGSCCPLTGVKAQTVANTAKGECSDAAKAACEGAKAQTVANTAKGECSDAAKAACAGAKAQTVANAEGACSGAKAQTVAASGACSDAAKAACAEMVAVKCPVGMTRSIVMAGFGTPIAMPAALTSAPATNAALISAGCGGKSACGSSGAKAQTVAATGEVKCSGAAGCDTDEGCGNGTPEKPCCKDIAKKQAVEGAVDSVSSLR